MTPSEIIHRPARLRDDPTWAHEYAAILKAYAQAGGVPRVLQARGVASLVVSANRVLGITEIPGVQLEAEPLVDGIRARITVAPGARIEKPIHLCFGMLPAEGAQRIVADYTIGDGAQVAFLAHCVFPNARDLRHLMEATVTVASGATLRYTEAHYHGPHGGIQVVRLLRGRVGRLAIDYVADVDARGVVDLGTMVYGMGDDDVEVRETVRLNGVGARGLAKTRIAVSGNARSRVFTTAEGNAPGARGHMDCAEIVRGAAVAENVPTVIVRSDQAHVTHEAAIGTVNKKELETLMARGLDEDTAVDVIIRGMLCEETPTWS
jgi:Fe-S cluster assembly scaffold protein SufB